MNPLVSIIIPIYNSSKYLDETLKSICDQSYQNWECILVDDGSQDESVAISKNQSKLDSRFKFFHRPTELEKGANSCRNYGFRMSKGDFVNWFDSDDVMLSNFIETKIRAVEENTQVVISSGFFSDSELKNHKFMAMYESPKLYEDYFLWKLKIITNSVLFKRDLLLKCKLFNTMLRKGQEFELFTRIFITLEPSSYKIITKPLFYYRSNDNSITTNNQKYNFCFKESESYTILSNLRMALEVGNKIVVKSAYRLLINLLYKAVRHDHIYNVSYILRGIEDNLGKNNKGLVHTLKLIIWFAKRLDLSFVRWDKFIKHYPLKIA